MKRILITTSIIGALLAFAASVTAQVGAEVALRAAIEKETVKGDLNCAIEQYEGGVVRPLAKAAGGGPPSWTPDSRHLFMSQPGSPQLYSIPADGGEPQPVGVNVTPRVAANPQNDHIEFGMGQSRKMIWLHKNLVPPATAQ